MAKPYGRDKSMKKHIIKEGSREHVLSWDSSGRHCSDPGCEINSGKRLYMQVKNGKSVWR